MKQTLTRRDSFNGRILDFQFEYYPPYPATLTQPEEAAEINILTITDLNGNNVQVPDCEDNGGDGTYEKMTELLLDIVTNENDYSEQTLAVEPWD
jgi:hypothetical protein